LHNNRECEYIFLCRSHKAPVTKFNQAHQSYAWPAKIGVISARGMEI